MEKVSLKLVVLYVFMTYMAIIIIQGRLLSGSVGEETAQQKEAAESKKLEQNAEGAKGLEKDNNPKNNSMDEEKKDNNPRNNSVEEEKKDSANDPNPEDTSGKFPESTVPSLRSLKSHLSTPAHLFEGTAD